MRLRGSFSPVAIRSQAETKLDPMDNSANDSCSIYGDSGRRLHTLAMHFHQDINELEDRMACSLCVGSNV